MSVPAPSSSLLWPSQYLYGACVTQHTMDLDALLRKSPHQVLPSEADGKASGVRCHGSWTADRDAGDTQACVAEAEEARPADQSDGNPSH